MQFVFNQKLNSKHMLIFFKKSMHLFLKIKTECRSVFPEQMRCTAPWCDFMDFFFEKKMKGVFCFWKSNSNAFLFSKNRCAALHLSLRCIYFRCGVTWWLKFVQIQKGGACCSCCDDITCPWFLFWANRVDSKSPVNPSFLLLLGVSLIIKR